MLVLGMRSGSTAVDLNFRIKYTRWVRAYSLARMLSHSWEEEITPMQRMDTEVPIANNTMG
jgi:hypothetical protein